MCFLSQKLVYAFDEFVSIKLDVWINHFAVTQRYYSDQTLNTIKSVQFEYGIMSDSNRPLMNK